MDYKSYLLDFKSLPLKDEESNNGEDTITNNAGKYKCYVFQIKNHTWSRFTNELIRLWYVSDSEIVALDLTVEPLFSCNLRLF